MVKSAPSDTVFTLLKELAPELPYMAVVRDTHAMHETLLHSGINYVGAEVLFDREDVEVASTAFIDKMHRDGKLVWVNAIIYDYHKQISAGHSDDAALCSDPDFGWGWLVRQGFDFIQTDWTLMLVNYLKETGQLYKK